VVAFCGPTDFTAFLARGEGHGPEAVRMLLGGTLDEKKDEAVAASPITHVSDDDPPFLLVHGTEDRTVPFDQAQRFHKALEEAKVDVTLVKVVGGGHGIGHPEVIQRVKAFFEKHLRGQDVEVSGEPIEAPARRPER
jgi:dipeptidyl aminopeptidase/acylaminoacyl peptidase